MGWGILERFIMRNVVAHELQWDKTCRELEEMQRGLDIMRGDDCLHGDPLTLDEMVRRIGSNTALRYVRDGSGWPCQSKNSH